MKPPSEQEMVRIAASVRLTGEMLEGNGTRTLVAASTWQRGPRSAPLEPSASDRYELVHEGTPDEFSARVPSDTVGEAALSEDPYDQTAVRFLHLVKLLDQTATEVRNIIYAACPQDTMADSFDPDTPAQISAAGWCVSCHRDGGYCEPVSMRPDGSRRYRDYCTWCGTYIANARKLAPKPKKKRKTEPTEKSYWPPLELIQAHHRGDRITQQMVERALKQDRRAS